MPVCAPAMPTDPAGTTVRGVASLGVAMRCGRPPRYGNPGMKPSMNTTYSPDAWRATTACRSRPGERGDVGQIGTGLAAVHHRNLDGPGTSR